MGAQNSPECMCRMRRSGLPQTTSAYVCLLLQDLYKAVPQPGPTVLELLAIALVLDVGLAALVRRRVAVRVKKGNGARIRVPRAQTTCASPAAGCTGPERPRAAGDRSGLRAHGACASFGHPARGWQFLGRRRLLGCRRLLGRRRHHGLRLIRSMPVRRQPAPGLSK